MFNNNDILLRKVAPKWKQDHIVQQNLAPGHTSELVNKYFADHRITVLDWSGNSLDLNPIETLRTILEQRPNQMDCTMKEKPIQ